MTIHQHATLGDTLHFWFAANDTSGSGADGASPACHVRKAGATITDASIISPTPALISHVDFSPGSYEVAVVATAGNGFAADATYAVFCTLAVDSQNPNGFVGSFTLTPLAKAAALATAQSDLDTLTGTDGATLATAQGNYAPAKAGDLMGLANDAITAAKIADNSITTDQLADGTITAAKIASDAITAAKVAADVHAEAADAVWDEVLTGASHNIATSAGRRLRQLDAAFIHDDGQLTNVASKRVMTLGASAVGTAGYYLGDRLQITEGAGAGQSRVIIAYTALKVVTLDSDFTTIPDTSSLYNVDAADVHVAASDADLAEGYLASVADTSNVTMDDATSVSATDYYKGDLIVITHGAGIGQSREIISQTGRALVVSPAFVTVPDTTSAFHIVAMLSAAEVADEVWEEAQADHTNAGTFGEIASDIAVIDGIVDAILVDTMTTLQAELDNLQTQIGTAGDGLTDITLANDLSATMKTSVQTAVDAALDTAIAELSQGIPTTNPTLRTGLMLMYMALRNRLDVNTSGVDELAIYNDAGTKIAKKLISDDTSDYSEAEMISGA